MVEFPVKNLEEERNQGSHEQGDHHRVSRLVNPSRVTTGSVSVGTSRSAGGRGGRARHRG